jgi:hypothetical protein
MMLDRREIKMTEGESWPQSLDLIGRVAVLPVPCSYEGCKDKCGPPHTGTSCSLSASISSLKDSTAPPFTSFMSV